MSAWVEFSFVLLGYLGLLLKSKALQTFKGSELERYVIFYCDTMLFIALIILLFKADDAVVSWVATVAYLIPVVARILGADQYMGNIALPLINMFLAASLAAIASVEAADSGWHPALKTAQIMSAIALYATIVTLPYHS